jgi:hypothetical protein
VHDVALLEFHDKSAAPPGAITEGVKVSVAVGMTFTTTVDGEELPPGPEQASE